MRIHRMVLGVLCCSGILLIAATVGAKGSSTVTCQDGTTSKAGRGACSHHGGLAKSGGDTAAAPADATTAPHKEADNSKRAAASHGADDSGDAAGATARCKDGTYSHSTHHTGTCSKHGGVAQWFDGSAR